MSEHADDELLSQGDIESLLNSAGQQQADGANPPGDQASPAQTTETATESEAASGSPDQLLDQAEADLKAAVAPQLDSAGPGAPGPENAQPFRFESLESSTTGDEAAVRELDDLQDLELDLRIELGRAELRIDEVLRLRQGSVVPLDKMAGDPVDILVNGRLVARGEVLVLDDNFCVRVAEILSPDEG